MRRKEMDAFFVFILFCIGVRNMIDKNGTVTFYINEHKTDKSLEQMRVYPEEFPCKPDIKLMTSAECCHPKNTVD